MRMVKSALGWGTAVALPGIAIAYLLRGRDGALSAAIAIGIVLANAGAAGAISALAGRISTATAALVSLPSFTFRMMMVLTAFALLQGKTFIDETTFGIAFGLSVAVVLAAESVRWARTPWISLTMKETT